MRKVVLRIAALAAWGLALAPLAPTFGQDAAPTLDAAGWWNKTQDLPVQGNPTGLDDPTGSGLTTAPTVPAPPSVPADGLYVANDASGPTAIAAVRYLAGGGGTLTLALADAATPTGTEELVACPVQGGFTPAVNGRWDSKPAYDPAACVVPGTVDATAKTVTFEVPSTFASSLGDVAVVIVPAVDSTTPFSLPFAKPADSSFVVTAPSPPSSSGTPSSPPFQPGASTFNPSTPPSFAAPSTPAAPTVPEATDGEVAAPVIPEASTPVVAVTPSRTSQAVAVAVLLVIGAALWWLTTQPQRAPRLLGSVGGTAAVPAQAVDAPVSPTSRPRGVGRFARHRNVPATPL